MGEESADPDWDEEQEDVKEEVITSTFCLLNCSRISFLTLQDDDPEYDPDSRQKPQTSSLKLKLGLK